MSKGIVYAAAAYLLWGLLPIYWKVLQLVPAIEVLSHRMAWSLLFVGLLLAYRRHWRWLRPALRNRRTVLTFLITAVVLSLNWFIYIWAVQNGHIVETSLGYFINPLVNVLLGVVFLKERLRAAQLVAIALAVVGVLYLTISYGAFPWIALTLAFSFALYGLLRKTAALPSTEGLFLETALMFLPAFLFLLYRQWTGTAAFGNQGALTTVLLIFSGVATGLPLLLFGFGARLISLTNLGLLQYIAPTIQFLIGVLIYGEDFGPARVVGFTIIWVALVVYTAESLLTYRRAHRLHATGHAGD
jgi:chloramphenicol-sensitive protein RarD